MPTVPNFSPSDIGIEEARLIAIQGMIQARIADLNTIFNRDTWTSDLLTTPFAALTSACVVIGEVNQLWPEEEGAVRISVVEGGHREGLDVESRYEFVDLGRKVDTLHTAVFGYFHSNAFRRSDPVVQAEKYTRAIARLSYFLRAGVLNRADSGLNNSLITLTSSEYVDAPDTDRMSDCIISQIMKFAFPAGMGADEVLLGLQIVHRGIVG